jgi:hypothetical protein
MKKQISLRDWELLSQYIDQQLSPRRQASLEARLRESPELKEALEDLQRTRSLLKSAPFHKAPRNFSLKPNMVSQRQPRRVYPVFQFASALASIMLVLVLVGDLLGVVSPVSSPMASDPESMEVLTMPMQGYELTPDASSRVVDPEEFRPEFAPEDPSLGILAETPEPGETTILEQVPPSVPGAEMTGEEETPAAGSEPQQDDFTELQYYREPWLSPLRLVQVSLALIALATALTAIYLRRIGA